MKCPFCDGTGKCYQQTITYEEVETNRTNRYLTKCFKCNGTGEIEQTNEEWFCNLSTEEKAEWIFNDRVEQSDWWYEQQGHTKAEVIEWLKQPHNAKE